MNCQNEEEAQLLKRINLLETIVRQHTSEITTADLIVSALRDENRSMAARIARLEAELATMPTLEAGKLPAKRDITQLWCQVFYTPTLTAKERKTKTEWSLRFTIWVNGQRIKREINVRLFPCDQFYNQVMHRSAIPDFTYDWAMTLEDNKECLAGMLIATTQGRGRPFIPTQFCVLNGHDADASVVNIVIDGEVVTLESVRPSVGTSRWFLDWCP